MSDRRSVSSSLSSQLIQYLRKRGHSQADIARMLRVSEGFISLVKSKDRSLTLDHVEMLADAMSVPLGALLMAATEPRRGAKGEKEFFALSSRIMKNADSATRAIMRGQITPSR
jgi:transcriptional regulator with XRE-family HTH domain